ITGVHGRRVEILVESRSIKEMDRLPRTGWERGRSPHKQFEMLTQISAECLERESDLAVPFSFKSKSGAVAARFTFLAQRVADHFVSTIGVEHESAGIDITIEEPLLATIAEALIDVYLLGAESSDARRDRMVQAMLAGPPEAAEIPEGLIRIVFEIIAREREKPVGHKRKRTGPGIITERQLRTLVGAAAAISQKGHMGYATLSEIMHCMGLRTATGSFQKQDRENCLRDLAYFCGLTVPVGETTTYALVQQRSRENEADFCWSSDLSLAKKTVVPGAIAMIDHRKHPLAIRLLLTFEFAATPSDKSDGASPVQKWAAKEIFRRTGYYDQLHGQALPTLGDELDYLAEVSLIRQWKPVADSLKRDRRIDWDSSMEIMLPLREYVTSRRQAFTGKNLAELLDAIRKDHTAVEAGQGLNISDKTLHRLLSQPEKPVPIKYVYRLWYLFPKQYDAYRQSLNARFL
ncbi:MAG TPA: hypothetical protein PKA91_13060, partial [Leptospiraceae bacterium]|nr:hypothetical protein [Leptospiraceae bacterium]